MIKLPPGWSVAPISSLCSLKNGRAFKPSEWTMTGLPIVRIQNLNNALASFNYFNGEFSERYYLQGGELLFAWSGTPGTSFGAHIWSGGEAVLNQHIFRVDFSETMIDKNFFRYAINQKLNELIDTAHGGVGLRHVTKGKFESTEIALAPLNEQKRIADKLDSILSRMDACHERLDRIPVILKRFRQALLAAATSGILTKEWRAEREIDSSWSNGTLEFLLDGKPRNGYSPRSVDKITFVKALTLTATTSGKFRGEYFKYIDEVIPKNSHLWLQPGDILIQRANTLEYVGTSALYEGLPAEFIYPDLMMKVRANNQVLTRFLLYILQSDKVRLHFRANATGTAGNMPKINQSTVLTAPASWPIIEEQTEIVRRVESLLAYADRLEARYTPARAKVDKLIPAILAKAFRGELLSQDPNDEPANVLLERIRAASGSPATKRRRSKSVNSATGS